MQEAVFPSKMSKQVTISRRLCLALPTFAIPVASCASLAYDNGTSLTEALTHLTEVRTEQELIDRIGEPRPPLASRDRLLSDLTVAERRSLAESVVQNPANILDTLPAEARTISYPFEYGSPTLPLRGYLAVFIAENGEIMGWIYSKVLARYTSKATLNRSYQRLLD